MRYWKKLPAQPSLTILLIQLWTALARENPAKIPQGPAQLVWLMHVAGDHLLKSTWNASQKKQHGQWTFAQLELLSHSDQLETFIIELLCN
jgi:hypothetical protein